eukprot:6523533-Prymnesium_polylepis.7
MEGYPAAVVPSAASGGAAVAAALVGAEEAVGELASTSSMPRAPGVPGPALGSRARRMKTSSRVEWVISQSLSTTAPLPSALSRRMAPLWSAPSLRCFAWSSSMYLSNPLARLIAAVGMPYTSDPAEPSCSVASGRSSRTVCLSAPAHHEGVTATNGCKSKRWSTRCAYARTGFELRGLPIRIE